MSTKTKKSLAGRLDSLFPNCKETTLLVVKEQEIKLTFFQKIKLHFHIMVCKFCRKFRIQSNMLHTHVHKLSEKAATDEVVFTLDEEKKAAMQNALLKRMNENN